MRSNSLSYAAQAEKSLGEASEEQVLGALGDLIDLSEEYGGMPSDELREEVVSSVRAKRCAEGEFEPKMRKRLRRAQRWRKE